VLTVRRRIHEPRAVIADFGKRLPKAVDETPFTLFICGPAPGRRQGAVLRQYVSTQMPKKISGVTVVWGEHRDFRGQIGESIHLKKFSDVTKELYFASQQSDLTIIFPDSPGSFVELGIFGMNARICPRLMVVFDERYRDQKSFVIDAMGEAAKNQTATIKFVRYHHRRAVLKELETIIRKKQESKYNSLSYDPR
jgi:hypothetical protein